MCSLFPILSRLSFLISSTRYLNALRIQPYSIVYYKIKYCRRRRITNCIRYILLPHVQAIACLPHSSSHDINHAVRYFCTRILHFPVWSHVNPLNNALALSALPECSVCKMKTDHIHVLYHHGYRWIRFSLRPLHTRLGGMCLPARGRRHYEDRTNSIRLYVTVNVTFINFSIKESLIFKVF